MVPDPDDLSPEAARHLDDLRSLLADLVSTGTVPPAHHTLIPTPAFESALAWARASVAEMFSAPPPTTDSRESEILFDGVIRLFPLGLGALVLYVGLLEEAVASTTADAEKTRTSVSDASQNLSSPFSAHPGSSDEDPAAVVLFVYLRLYAIVSAASSLMDLKRLQDCAEITLALVMTSMHPR